MPTRRSQCRRSAWGEVGRKMPSNRQVGRRRSRWPSLAFCFTHRRAPREDGGLRYWNHADDSVRSKKSAAAKGKRESNTGIRVEMYGCDAASYCIIGLFYIRTRRCGRQLRRSSRGDAGTEIKDVWLYCTSLAFCYFYRLAVRADAGTLGTESW